MRRVALSVVLPFIVVAFAALPTRAQSPENAPTVFAKSRLGLTQYTGENSPAVLQTQCGAACAPGAFGAAMEVGIQWSPALGASVGYQTANYPSVAAFDAVPAYYARNYRVRETLQLLTHYRFSDLMPRLTPYLQSGVHVTTGRTPLPQAMRDANGQMRVVERWAFGPSFGAGVDVAVNRHLAVFAEVATNVAFPDDALDGQGGFFGADRLSWAGLGLRVNSASLPQRFLSADDEDPVVPVAKAPLTLTVDEVGHFEVDVDDDDPAASEFWWSFSDGSLLEGASVTKQFDARGTYQAAVHGPHGGSPVHTFQVRVRSAPNPLHIDAIRTTSDTLQAGHSIAFEPVLRSGVPVEYRWTFGDGTTAFTRAPIYTYQSPGRYEVTLRVIGSAGQATHRRTVVVGGTAEYEQMTPYFVQIGAFSDAERAERYARRHANQLPKPPDIRHDGHTGLHRVGVAFSSENRATRTLQRLRRSTAFTGAFLHHRTSRPSTPSVAERR
jgi:chitodextrinase